MKINQQQRQLAWQSAFETRACPSESMLFSSIKCPEIKAHVAFCKMCQEKINTTQEDKEIWASLAKKLMMKFTAPSYDANPEAGQVWSLSRKLNGWGPSNLYYNAPNVLLIEQISGSKNGFKVAQLCSSPELMGQNDIWLSDRFGFAETWNTYSIHRKDLECCWGSAPHNALIKVVTKLQKIECATDSLEEMRKDGVEGSIFNQFRNLESEIGSYFALQSVARLVFEYQQEAVLSGLVDKVKEIFVKAKETIGDLGTSIGVKGWTFPDLTPQLAAARKKIGEEKDSFENLILSLFGQATPVAGLAYAKGESTDGEITFPANYLKISSSELELRQETVMLETPTCDERGLVIVGRIDTPSQKYLNAWWILDDKEPLPATSVSLYEKNQFTIIFEGLDKLARRQYETRLKLLLLDMEAG